MSNNEHTGVCPFCKRPVSTTMTVSSWYDGAVNKKTGKRIRHMKIREVEMCIACVLVSNTDHYWTFDLYCKVAKHIPVGLVDLWLKRRTANAELPKVNRADKRQTRLDEVAP